MRMPARFGALAMLISSILVPTVTHAQRSSSVQRPEGFWLSGGIGVRMDPWGEQVQPQALGYTIVLRVGGTLSERIRLGGELIHWTASPDGLKSVRENTTVSALFYPLDEVNGFVKAGMGLSVIHADVAVDGSPPVGITTEGFAVTPGIGIDIPVSRAVMLTPSLDWLLSIGHPRGRGTSSIMVFSAGLTLR